MQYRKVEILNVKKLEYLNKRNQLQTGCLHYQINFFLNSAKKFLEIN